MYEDYDSEVLSDGSIMETHRLGVREVLLQRCVDNAGVRGVVWGQVCDPGPVGAEHVDSPVRELQRKMRRTPWAFDRRPGSVVRPSERMPDSGDSVGSAW